MEVTADSLNIRKVGHGLEYDTVSSFAWTRVALEKVDR